MKRNLTAPGLCLLLVGGGYTLADPLTYEWNGITSAYWDEWNWEVGGVPILSYPGQNQGGDTAIIADGTNIPVELDVDLAYSVATVEIDADDNAETVALKIVTGGKLETTGLVTTKSDQDGTATATFWHDTGDFVPYAMRFWGRDHASDGHAKGDFDQTFSVTKTFTVRQYADMDVALGKTVTVNTTLQVGDDSEDFFGYLYLDGGGTLKADTVVIEGDISAGPVEKASTLEVSSGSIQTQ